MPPARVYLWQNNLCITYTVVFKQFEDFFVQNGWEIVTKPEDADWLLVGACSGFLPQIKDYHHVMGSLVTFNKKMAVYGCLPSVAVKDYKDSTPSSALVIPTRHPERIEKIIPDRTVAWKDIADPAGFRKIDYRNYDPCKKYIILQNGCEMSCIYCPHKAGIGDQVSRPKEEILGIVRQALSEGAHTLFLEGMDSGSWGADLAPPQTYLDVLLPILEMPGEFQVHVSQFGANWALRFGDELLKAFCHRRITDIKIPIQTTSPRLLTLMGRDPRVEELAPFLKALRDGKKGMALRTDLIIGFPTETDAELSATLEFVSQYFTEVACFGFEIHPITPIAKMDLPFLPAAVIEERVRYAREYLEKNGRVITHRGGQDGRTLLDREKRIASGVPADSGDSGAA